MDCVFEEFIMISQRSNQVASNAWWKVSDFKNDIPKTRNYVQKVSKSIEKDCNIYYS